MGTATIPLTREQLGCIENFTHEQRAYFLGGKKIARTGISNDPNKTIAIFPKKDNFDFSGCKQIVVIQVIAPDESQSTIVLPKQSFNELLAEIGVPPPQEETAEYYQIATDFLVQIFFSSFFGVSLALTSFDLGSPDFFYNETPEIMNAPHIDLEVVSEDEHLAVMRYIGGMVSLFNREPVSNPNLLNVSASIYAKIGSCLVPSEQLLAAKVGQFIPFSRDGELGLFLPHEIQPSDEENPVLQNIGKVPLGSLQATAHQVSELVEVSRPFVILLSQRSISGRLVKHGSGHYIKVVEIREI